MSFELEMKVGQWLWLSWLSGRFQLKIPAVRIMSLAKFILNNVYCQLFEKTKIKEMRPRMAHLIKKEIKVGFW